MNRSVTRPRSTPKVRPDPRASVTGIACRRVIPGSTSVTANRAVQAALERNETCSFTAPAEVRAELWPYAVVLPNSTR